jgi:thymidylate synthase (FAD)
MEPEPILSSPGPAGAGSEAPPRAPDLASAGPAAREMRGEGGGELADEELVDALPAGPLREVKIDELGFVRFVDAMPRLVQMGGLGPEAAVVQAARVSYGAGTKTVRTDEALLRYLLRHEHLTPFEMVSLKFCVRAPLFTARQWLRHRSAAANEESARYSVIEPAFYVPAAEDVRAQSGANRQGAGEQLGAGDAEGFREAARKSFEAGHAIYSAALDAGVARELARIVLPEGRYTTFYWTVSLRNLFGFLKLRMNAAAQDNIRAYARALHGLARLYCPLALRAFDDFVLGAVTLSAPELDALRLGVPPAGMSAREKADWAQKKKALGLGA